MDRVTLEALPDAEQVNPAAYSLQGGMPSEAYVLEPPRAADWAVYYSERGLRSGEVVFQTEHEACSYFLDLVLSDDTTREPRSLWRSGSVDCHVPRRSGLFGALRCWHPAHS